MTRDEAQKILLLYRPGTPDAAEPEIAEALALAKEDAELAHWLEQHCAQQKTLRAKIRQIPVPAALKEQIISERVVFTQKRNLRRTLMLTAVSALVILLGWWANGSWQRSPNDDTFSNYRSRMVSTALRDYSMDFESSSVTQIRAYLGQKAAAADFELPAGLQKAAASGCALASWQNAKATMICFRTGQPLPPGAKSDLWLFVIDRASVKDAPANASPQFARVNKLITAMWTQGDKLYLLGTAGDEQMLRNWL